ncbi:MAG: hypothetical protein H0V81_12335 [Solirubrobacterales bacterium]|nr:hypothetical protein [Solirubrobacterales bacterium]
MSRCPECREPVSQFAAGCAVCGADLEQARRSRSGRRRLSLPAVPAVPEEVVAVVTMSLITIFVPVFGALLTAFVLHHRRAWSGPALRVALWVVLGVAIVLVILPSTRSFGLAPYLY